jgi:hypothetical protein
MRRRDKAGGNTVKTQRRKTLKRRNTPNSVAPDEVTDVARLARERDEAREQLTARGAHGHEPSGVRSSDSI